MTAQNIIDDFRDMANEEEGGRRWEDKTLRRLINTIVSMTVRIRPDAQLDTSGDLITITDVSANTDTVSISDEWRSVVVDGVAWRAFRYEGGDKKDAARAAAFRDDYLTIVKV